MIEQSGDILLYQTTDNGEIEFADGFLTMTEGFETAVYLALFGGNFDDDGRDGGSLEWWGNLITTEPTEQYRSETQNIVEGLPVTSGNLRRVEDAARRDLSFLLSRSIASSVDVSARVLGRDTLELNIVILAEGEESRFSFVENWRSYLKQTFKEPAVAGSIGTPSGDGGLALLESGDFLLLENGDTLGWE